MSFVIDSNNAKGTSAERLLFPREGPNVGIESSYFSALTSLYNIVKEK